MADVLLEPDLCVIGAGSGGLTVAAAAANLGVPVVLIERGRMGGDCLNYGCVPSKALLAAARSAAAVRRAHAFGIAAGEATVDFAAVHAHVHETIAAIAPVDSAARFTALGVHVLAEEARFVDRRSVVAGRHLVRARRFVVATGSAPAVPPIPGLEAVPFLTNETIFDLPQRPTRLAIIGGGPIGLEMAQAFRRLGSEVTVLEGGDAVLAREDPELASVVAAALQRDGVELITRAMIDRVEGGEGGVRIQAGALTVEASHLLVATGRRPTVAGLSLEAAGIRYSDKGIEVDSGLKTSNGRVFAIGDVVGGPQFTHLSAYHAGLVVRSALLRLPVRADLDHIPRVTYTDPELAHVGLTEDQARGRAGKLRVLRSSYAENDRARAERETEGHIKLVADSAGHVLGASLVGAQAGELIALWCLVVSKRMKLQDVAGLVLPYPTLAEIGRRAALDVYREAAQKPLTRRVVGWLRHLG